MNLQDKNKIELISELEEALSLLEKIEEALDEGVHKSWLTRLLLLAKVVTDVLKLIKTFKKAKNII